VIDHEVVLLAVAEVFDQVDPPPGHVTDAARGVFGTRTTDDELLPMLNARPSTSARVERIAPVVERWFTFADTGLEVEVKVGARREPHGWALVGRVSMPVETLPVETLSVQTLTAVEPVVLDEQGRFEARVSSGPVRLKLHAPRGPRYRTEWVTL
jgi:hypothetical protein